MDGGAPILLPHPPVYAPASAVGREILAADLFCGAGGTSTGMDRALKKRGLRLRLVAVNHWQTAVDTHSDNHPEAEHFCQDLATLRPLVAVPGGRLDILVASPTCTYHSRARGGRPTSDQQRMDPWHVVTWLTELRVARVTIENVPEFVKWGPVDPETGRPIKAREGEFFQAWVRTLQAIGFVVDWRIVNCAEFGDATTRKRFLLIGRSDGLPLRWAEPSFGRPGTPGRQRWRVARDIIDWRRKGRDALGRPVPLKPNTLRRTMVGVERHFGPLAPAYLAALEVELARSIARWGDKTAAKSGRKPAQPSATTAPAVVELRGTACAHSVDAPVPGITAGGYHLGVAVPEVEPFILNRQGADSLDPNRARAVSAPIPTITTRGGGYLAQADAQPFMLGQQSGSTARAADEPLMTIAGAGAIALAQPTLVVLKGRSTVADLDAPAPTITSVPSLGVAEPVLFHVNHQGDDARLLRVDEPIPTATSKRGLGLASPLIAPYYGNGSGTTCKPVDEPLDTVTAKARFGLVEPILDPAEPFVAIYNGDKDGRARAARPVSDPIPTITTEPRLALCEPAPEPLGVDLEAAFAGSAELRHLATARRLAVIDGVLCVLKLPFRMLGNDELARAMSFPDGYRFAGKPEEVTKQIGNAVPVMTAEAHIAALFED